MKSIHAVVLALGVVLMLNVGCGDDPDDPERVPSADWPRLFLAGDGELWTVDVDKGRVKHREMRELSPGDPPYRIVRRGEHLVLWGYTTYALDPELEGRLRPIARDSWIFVPSADPNRVWVGFLDPASPETERALSGLREISAEGKVTVSDVNPPRGAWPELALDSGLLFPAGGHSFEIWDPRTKRVVRHLPAAEIGNPAAAYGDELVSCLEPCDELLLTDVGEEQEPRSILAPSGLLFDYWEAEFSPDGEIIAIPVHERDDGEGDRELALVAVASGRVTVVDSSTVPGGYNFVAWSASGEHVFLAGERTFRDRVLVAYRLDEPNAQRLDAKVGAFFGMAAN